MLIRHVNFFWTILQFIVETRKAVVMINAPKVRHPREGGDPGNYLDLKAWAPAFAGVTPVRVTVTLLRQH